MTTPVHLAETACRARSAQQLSIPVEAARESREEGAFTGGKQGAQVECAVYRAGAVEPVSQPWVPTGGPARAFAGQIDYVLS